MCPVYCVLEAKIQFSDATTALPPAGVAVLVWKLITCVSCVHSAKAGSIKSSLVCLGMMYTLFVKSEFNSDILR